MYLNKQGCHWIAEKSGKVALFFVPEHFYSDISTAVPAHSEKCQCIKRKCVLVTERITSPHLLSVDTHIHCRESFQADYSRSSMLLNGYLKDGAVSINAEAELIIWEWSFRKYCKSFNWLLTNIQIDIYKRFHILDTFNRKLLKDKKFF